MERNLNIWHIENSSISNYSSECGPIFCYVEQEIMEISAAINGEFLLNQ
jgi:hypothetical protein